MIVVSRKIKHYLFLFVRRIFTIYLRKTKVKDNLIFLEAYSGRFYSCSPKAMYEYILSDSNYDKYSFVWSFTNPENYSNLKSRRTKVVKYKSLRHYIYRSKAKYWIVNGWINHRTKKKADQIMVQCWHGTPLKRLRVDTVKNTQNATMTYDDIVKANKLDVVRYDYLISPSRFCTEVFTSAFDLKSLGKEDILIEKGYPRNDFLLTYEKRDLDSIRLRLGIGNSKKIILYAPTWRDDSYDKDQGFIIDNPIDFDEWRDRLSEDYIILFRAHYQVAKLLDIDKYKGFVYDVSDLDDINELYVISDILITDYSSVFFDYSNLKRPILFYMYDIEHYRDNLRGFYIDLDELPGPILSSTQELIESILSIDDVSKEYESKYNEFVGKYNPLEDGMSSKRVVKEILGKG